MSTNAKNPVIGIVGGRGEMGRCFVDFFRRQGWAEKEILISGRTPDGVRVIANTELVRRADVVIVSVFLKDSVRVITELAPQLKHGQLFVDVSSLKTPQIAAMLHSKADVLGLHPMFGGNASFVGQVVVACPARVGATWRGWLEKLLEKEGATIVRLTAAEHDRRVPLVQTLPHFLGLTFADALAQMDCKISEVRELATPNAKLLLDFAARVLTQKADLVHEIQKANPANTAVFAATEASVTDWQTAIAADDTTTFERRFTATKRFFKQFLDEGYAESQLLLDTIARRSLKITPRATPPVAEKARLPTMIFGGAGSNTDDAAHRFFSEIEGGARKTNYAATIGEALRTVAIGRARNAVVPFENETGGIIRETFEQLFTHTGKLKIDTLVGIEIHHALAVAVTTDAADIRTIYSHPQALTQCAENLHKHFPNAELIPIGSTVQAFEAVGKLRGAAAIGPLAKAHALGLKIVRENFEDRGGRNTTTFAVVTKRKTARQQATHTLAAFAFDENKPGQLVETLRIFENERINLSRILSIEQAPNEYLFFVEFEGIAGNPRPKKALAAAKKLATVYEFGSYRKI